MRDFVRGVFKFLGVIVLLLLVAAGVLYGFFVRIVEVGHNAMAPTVMLGDRVVVWRSQSFDLGDVVLCPHPEMAGRYVLGRIVGRTGQRVKLDRGGLYINGQSVDRDLRPPIDWVNAETGRTERMVWGIEDLLDHEHPFFYRERSIPMFREREVSPGYFILSDNRSYAGEDSRSFGSVAPLTCVGKLFMRLTAAPDSPPEIGNGPLDLLE